MLLETTWRDLSVEEFQGLQKLPAIASAMGAGGEQVVLTGDFGASDQRVQVNCAADGILAAQLLACYLPARRAAGLDPMAALRQD